ncbi:MAG: hypothetical protein IPL70_09335 [Uliginosibacterium sp.]|nr:hypothetical protein [Uliginosibacterium sp.]
MKDYRGLTEGCKVLVRDYGLSIDRRTQKIKEYGIKRVGTVRMFIHEDHKEKGHTVTGFVLRTKSNPYDFYCRNVYWVLFKNIHFKILKQ